MFFFSLLSSVSAHGLAVSPCYVQEPELISEINNIEYVNIDLNNHIETIAKNKQHNGIKVLAGIDCGRAMRKSLDLDSLDSDNKIIILNQPENVLTSTTFFQGLFQQSLERLGFTDFYNKYKINSPYPSINLTHAHYFHSSWESFAKSRICKIYYDDSYLSNFPKQCAALDALEKEFWSRFPETYYALNVDLSKPHIDIGHEKVRNNPNFFGKTNEPYNKKIEKASIELNF